jgi:hypothetical protein
MLAVILAHNCENPYFPPKIEINNIITSMTFSSIAERFGVALSIELDTVAIISFTELKNNESLKRKENCLVN